MFRATRNMFVSVAVAWLVCVAGSGAEAQPEAELPFYTISRAECEVTVDGTLAEACWQQTSSVGDFLFPWYESGEQEQTEVRILWDDRFLYVCFVAHDQYISATLTARDAPVSRDDAVEIFVAPDTSNVASYFNFEFNALGTILDRSPRNGRSKSWNADGIQVAITIDGTLNSEGDADREWTTEIAIPFTVFDQFAPRLPPAPDDVWRLNLYRIGGVTNPQFSVWSDTQTAKPQYHVPERFGFVRFSDAGPGATAIKNASLGEIKVGALP